MLIYMFITGTLMAIQYWNEYDKANCFNFNIRYYDLNTAVKLSLETILKCWLWKMSKVKN